MTSAPFPALTGSALEVPLASGGTRRYVNLDAAASTPMMSPVLEAVNAALPWYSSVHRGAGFASQVSTRLYEASRTAVARFVGARSSDTVVVVRNTTDALNHLARCLPLEPGTAVLTTLVEHHANLLPWRRVAPVVHLPPPSSPGALVGAVEQALRERHPRIAVVAITGASNVTGEVFPIAEVARVTHEHGAILVVDGAQLAPHRAIDMAAQGIDCLALSGHKMYAPLGAGALVVSRALLETSEPLLAGGGAVDFVTLDDVLWTSLPERLEAGSPNLLGAIGMGAAATTLAEVGMERIAEHERRLLAYLEGRLNDVPGTRVLRLWQGPGVDRVGTMTFTVEGHHHALVAAALSAEHAIGVRHGCFCAHPYITHLLGIRPEEAESIRLRLREGQHANVPGAVRASFHIGTTIDDLERLASALETIVRDGPRLRYQQDARTGDFHPVPDPRPFPVIPHLPVAEDGALASGCGRF